MTPCQFIPFQREDNFVGNRRASSLDLVGPDKTTLREKYLIGEPRDCPHGSAEEMKRAGYVGIYRKSGAITYRLPGTNLTITVQPGFQLARPKRSRRPSVAAPATATRAGASSVVTQSLPICNSNAVASSHAESTTEVTS
jgi:hypothetical protein